MSRRRFARNMRDNRICYHEGCKKTAKFLHLVEWSDGNQFRIEKRCRRHELRDDSVLETQGVPPRRCSCCRGKDTHLVALVGYDYSYSGPGDLSATGEPVIDVWTECRECGAMS